MDKYIKLIDICEANDCFNEEHDCDHCVFNKIPSSDVQPVKHGRWIWDSNAPHREHGAYKCSNCGCHSDFEENYCYNCGARMDGE